MPISLAAQQAHAGNCELTSHYCVEMAIIQGVHETCKEGYPSCPSAYISHPQLVGHKPHGASGLAMDVSGSHVFTEGTLGCYVMLSVFPVHEQGDTNVHS